jgi:prepilin-type N-terminal cleavage/methylation domain-containing protein
MSANKGFALLEAVVALTIIGTASVAALGAYSAELNANRQATDVLIAEILLEEQRSRLHLLPAHALRSLPDSMRSGTFPRPWTEYEWRSAVQEDRSMPSLFRATVVITRRGDQAVSWSVTTRLYRPGGISQ